MPALATPQEVQAALNAMVTSGSPVNCTKAFAGDVEIGSKSGELKWKTGVKISTGHKIWAAGSSARTRITFLGRHEDPPCFLVYSYTGNGYVDMPSLDNFQIDTPNGGRAVGVDPSVTILENFEMNHITTTGMVDLMCEQYGTLLKVVRIYTNPAHLAKGYQLLRMGGGKSNRGGACNTLFHCKLQGYSAIGAKAACEFNGSVSIEGNTRFEDLHHDHTPEGADPMLYFGDWIDNEGKSHRGNHAVAGLFYDEAHKERLWARVEKSDLHAINTGATSGWPWQLGAGAGLYLQRPINAGAVKGSGKLYVGGESQAIEPVR